MKLTKPNPNDYAIRIVTGIIYEVQFIDEVNNIINLSRVSDMVEENLSFDDFNIEFKLFKKGTELAKNIESFQRNLSDDAFKILCYEEEKDVLFSIDADKFNEELQENLDKIFEQLITKPKIDREIKTKTIRKSVSSVSKNVNNIIPRVAPPKKKQQEEVSDGIVIIKSEEGKNIEDIVLHEKTKSMVDQALCKIELSSFLDNEWGFTEFAPINEKCLLNFFGPPGTGKTMLAKSIGKRLKKDIIQVDYSGLISKWVGDTGKNIKNYFSKATKENMILFFDEADALLMPRNGGGNTEQYNIQNQNIFMQEVDKFKGIVILTTNNFKQYDEALLRRFDHIPFDLPDINMRKNIIKSHLSSKIIWGDDFTIDKLAIDTDGFSGGDLKNVISNGLINNALSVKNKNSDKSTEELVSLLKQTIVEYKFFFEEVLRIKKIKKEHGIISSKKVPLGLAT